MTPPTALNRIDGHARTLHQLLHGARFAIDFYQREYAWERRQVTELLDDLSGKFLDSYEDDHERGEVGSYGHYFLGSIVICNKNGHRFVVDGQQRLTTLSLLLIHLQHLAKDSPALECANVETLVFSTKYGRRSFNIDVDDRAACMERLLNREAFEPSNATESVKNIVARFADIREYFPEDLGGRALPYFIDWLCDHVHLVEIEAYSDEDAYTIFETMNDRGLSLRSPEMLKGYLLANIGDEAKQRSVDGLWKRQMLALKELGQEEDVDFFKNWLRARYAETIRQGDRSAENRDYERIGSEFHRWVRDRREQLGLSGTSAFVRFVERDFDFYATQTLAIRRAAKQPMPGIESVYFNDLRGFTTQTQLLLAALSPDDPAADIKRKLALVADYVDIWLARQVWASRSTAQRNAKHGMFGLTRAIRGKSVAELSALLRARLDEDRVTFARNPDLTANQHNFYAVRHVLARITHWVDIECGVHSHFEDYASSEKARPYEVEHIWPDHPERFRTWFGHDSEFERARNRIGGMVLLQRGTNQSLGDKAYEEKRDAYVAQGESILTRSLHPLAYKNNPAFRAFIERTALPFQHHDAFDPQAQQQRQELYLRIAEWVWNPSRLDLDGIRPPTPEPLTEHEDEGEATVDKSVRHQKRKVFWTHLIERSRAVGGPHGRLTPSEYNWIGAREGGLWWNFNVTQNATRVELFISTWSPEKNKAIFDRLKAARASVEADFGGALDWLRLEENRSSKVMTSLDGGWLDEAIYDDIATRAVALMTRFHKALAAPARAAKEAVLAETPDA
jgi:hypothetical protein